MTTSSQTSAVTARSVIASGQTMLAALLHGAKTIRLERLPVPQSGPGMVLLKVRRAGLCGSDMHYFEHGHCGSFVPGKPFVLGHELTGEVVALGEGVRQPLVGARVTVNPARSCGVCAYCAEGRSNLCPHTIMLGSASTVPPTDGAYAEYVAVRCDQCHVLPEGMDDGIGAMIEPLAVALHAVRRAGNVAGKRILVAGAGPIGLLVAAVAQTFGVKSTAMSDPLKTRRETASRLGVKDLVDPMQANAFSQIRELTGDGFDILFEASGAPPALRQAFHWVRPGGTIVQIGTLGAADIPLPANQIMTRELQVFGSFRYGSTFAEAVELAASGRVPLSPFLSEVFPLREISSAFERASNKDNVLKVQLDVQAAS